MSANVSLNLDATAAYTVDISALTSEYGTAVAQSSETIGFEYYADSTTKLAISALSKTDDGTNTTVSFTISSYTDTAVTPVVIAAAYNAQNELIGVKTASVTATANADVSDSITLEKVTGAAEIQLMVWDSLSGMKPYCVAKEIN